MVQEDTRAAEIALRTEKIKFRTALFTGIAAIIAAAIGLVIAFHNANQANNVAVTSQSQASQLQDQNQSLKQQLANAQATISAMQNTSTLQASDPSSTTKRSAGSPIAQYSLQLPPDQWAVLGATQPTQAQMSSAGTGDLNWRADLGGPNLYTSQQDHLVQLDSGATPTYQACH